MPKLYEVTNPMTPSKGLIEHDVNIGFLTSEFVPSKACPYLVYVNGKPCTDPQQLHEDDVAVYVPCVHGGPLVVAIVIGLVVAAAVFFFIKFSVPSLDTAAESPSVYTLKGQSNQVKEGEVIERHYGNVRHWPSYAARPYNQYIGNNQWLYALFCVGIGDIEVDEVLVDDSPYTGEYAVYKPGENVTLFPTNVFTSVEVANIELLGTNESGHDYTGPHVVCPSGRVCYYIEFDLSLRNGLYTVNSKGKFKNASVSVVFEARLIDASGGALGGWFVIANFSRTMSTTDSQYFTVGATVADGRYEIRAKRTNATGDSKSRSSIYLEAARAHIRTEQNFGDVTLLAIKAQASDKLNDSSSSKFNCRIRNKAWSYEDVGGWAIRETRSPIWAACDALMSPYGGNLPTSTIDIDHIKNLASEIEAEGITFDGTFDKATTPWEAAEEILMSSRCKPDITNLFTISRDVPATVPLLCLNSYNIVKDSLKISYNLRRGNDYDGVEVEYNDPETWEAKSVKCLLLQDEGNRPERVRLSGCTSRNEAYRWGLYRRATQLFQNYNVTVSTGLEGAHISYGDLVAVQHDILADETLLDHSGRLTSDIVVDSGSTYITLPFRPEFYQGEVYRIAIRNRTGGLEGPYVCTQGIGNVVIIDGELDLSNITTVTGEEMPTYFFGISSSEVFYFKVIDIKGGDNDEVELVLSPYKDEIYAYTDAIAPEENNDFSYPSLPYAPLVTGLIVEQALQSTDLAYASWNPTLGSVSYVIEIMRPGDDDFSTYLETTITSATLTIDEPGEYQVRVAAVGKIRGEWDTWVGNLGESENAPFDADAPFLSSDFVGASLEVECEDVLLATSYLWKVYFGTDLVSTIETIDSSLSYSSSKMEFDASAIPLPPQRELTITVSAKNSMGTSLESDALIAENPPPASPTGLSATVLQVIGSQVRYIFSWLRSIDEDIDVYYLHISTVNGFVPSGANLAATTSNNSAEAVRNPNATYYYRVGAKDRWGNEVIYSNQSSFGSGPSLGS